MAKKKNKGAQVSKQFSEKNYMRQKMRSLPLGKCYISPDDDSEGEQIVFVTRKHPAGTITCGHFLIDKYCCGVKDATYFFSMGEEDFEKMLRSYDKKLGIKEISYPEAHNLIYGALEYAEDIGIPPHPDFGLAQYVLEEDTEDIPLIEYEFGKNGKPFLICHDSVELDHYRKLLLKKLSPDEFETLYIDRNPEFRHYKADDPDYEEYDEEDEDGYETYKEWIEETEPCIMVKTDNNENRDIPFSVFGPVGEDISQQISGVTPVRKAAYFIILRSLAKQIKVDGYGINELVETMTKAIDNYDKNGVADFGEAIKALVAWKTSTYKKFEFEEPADVDEEDTHLIAQLILSYAAALQWVNLNQEQKLVSMISNAGERDKELEHCLDKWLKLKMILYIEGWWRDAGEAKDTTCLSLIFENVVWNNFVGKYSGRSVNTQVRKIKKDFVSKDPAKYYRTKIREALSIHFEDDEDFTGLIYFLRNLSYSAIQHVMNGHPEQAAQIWTNIIWNTLDFYFDGSLDEWLKDEDMLRNLSEVLRGTVSCLALMIYFRVLDFQLSIDILKKIFDYKITLCYHLHIVDLDPIIYAIQTSFDSPY